MPCLGFCLSILIVEHAEYKAVLNLHEQYYQIPKY